MSTTPFCTRFAPSPTGFMHIGNLRTALYAYLLARSTDGRFIVRIEDTDQERLVEGAVDVILNTLKLSRIDYDEGPVVGGEHGPYIQSERKEIYKKYAEQLVQAGHAYYCFCTEAELQEQRGDGFGGYNRHCRDLPKEEIERHLQNGDPYVIRQKMPLTGETSYFDEVFGEISISNEELQDQILMKTDGYPTYNFAHVVDDHLMQVTHVVRGCEYLTSTPKYVLLYDAFGWERPHYVHLPLLMGKSDDGKISKLSKRHGAVSFQDLVALGYLPAAIINYVAFLGWCPKDCNTELFTLEELKKLFSVEGISKSPAVFDYEKLKWMNAEYIKEMPPEEFAAAVKPLLPATGIDVDKLVALLQSRVSTLNEVTDVCRFAYERLPIDKEAYVNKKNKTTPELCRDILLSVKPLLEAAPEWNNDALFELLKAYAEESGQKTGAVMWAVRIAVARQLVTPGGATELMAIFGREESLSRMELALEELADWCD